MDVSIIIPVFNKSGLTRVCLKALRDTLPSSVRCETIVVDNNSTDDTQRVLAEFPWITVITNESNRGFAAANNQGAEAATGTFLLLLNNDTEPRPGWIEALLRAAATDDVGVVGARLLFPNYTIQHAGVVVSRERFGPHKFTPYHYLWSNPATDKTVMQPHDYQIVTGACMLTPRTLYQRLGGLDEAFWNGYEDVDYCFKVLQAAKRVVYEPMAQIVHYESQSGPMRFSRSAYNARLLAKRWGNFPRIDHTQEYLRAGYVRRTNRFANKFSTISVPSPKATILVHGCLGEIPPEFARQLSNTNVPVERIIWTLETLPPAFGDIPVMHVAGDPIAAARAEMEVRGDRYFVVVDAGMALQPFWLDKLVEELEFGSDVVAATVRADESPHSDYVPLTADARCTALTLRHLPQHETLLAFPTLGGAVADLLMRMLPYEFGTRVGRGVARTVLRPQADSHFEAVHGMALEEALKENLKALERILAKRDDQTPPDAKVSIVMLSWNAPQFTKIALESIRAHTKMPYEVIIVDNGSGPETTDWLREQDDIHVIFNPRNLGFAAGCNQGIAAATGDYVVLLNNDVAVTDDWLENLVDALRRDPATGVSAPRSNEIAGDQKLLDLDYKSLEEMQAVAAKRSRAWRRSGYFTDRAIGFCLCIDRRVLEQVGGIDEAYGTGNFEDDDFCMRVRAAGYRIYVCNDVLIHHFGSVSFQANKVDYAETMSRNWAKFAAKWGYPATYPVNGYNSQIAIRHGFDRRKHFVPVSAKTPVQPVLTDSATKNRADLLLVGVVRDEADWTITGGVLRRCLNAFSAGDSVTIAVACAGNLNADLVGSRVERMIAKAAIHPAECVDIFVADDVDYASWIAGFWGQHQFIMGATDPQLPAFAPLEARSPSQLRRLYESLRSSAPT